MNKEKEPIPPLSPHEDIGYRRPSKPARRPNASRRPKAFIRCEGDWHKAIRIAKFKGYWLPEWGPEPDSHPDAPEACKREWQAWKSVRRVDPSLRNKVAEIMGDGFCASYLDQCTLADDGALVAATSTAYDRLRVCKPLQGIRVLPPVVKAGASETGRR